MSLGSFLNDIQEDAKKGEELNRAEQMRINPTKQQADDLFEKEVGVSKKVLFSSMIGIGLANLQL